MATCEKLHHVICSLYVEANQIPAKMQ